MFRSLLKSKNAHFAYGISINFLGPIVEEGLIIGFSILMLLIIISVVLSVLNWSQGLVNDLLHDLGG